MSRTAKEWGITQGAKLRELRLKKGFSQEYVAKKVGRSDASIWTYEAGKGRPKDAVLHDLAFLYNVTVEEITGEVDPVPELSRNPLNTQEFVERTVERAVELMAKPSNRRDELVELMAKLSKMEKQDIIDEAIRSYAAEKFDWAFWVGDYFK